MCDSGANLAVCYENVDFDEADSIAGISKKALSAEVRRIEVFWL